MSLAVPCDTASRAREIQVRGRARQPQPLRSDREPLGRTDVDLNALERDGVEKVRRANEVYAFAAQFARHCSEVGVMWVL